MIDGIDQSEDEEGYTALCKVGEVEAETEKAVLVDDEWFPKSQLRQDSYELFVPDWLMEEKGLA